MGTSRTLTWGYASFLPVMDTAPTTSITNIYSLPPSPPVFFPPDDSRSIDLSPLEFILALLGIITIPALVYTFFFSFRFSSNPFRRRHGHYTPSLSCESELPREIEAVSEIIYQKEAHVKDLGTECPVCLSVFADGEEIKQLNVCKHSFHATCIGMWLSNHSNCPICRVTLTVKRRSSSSVPTRNVVLHQGLPDAATDLV